MLTELQRLRIKAARAYEHRALPTEDRRWLLSVDAALALLIDVGNHVLSENLDPREWKKARKRVDLHFGVR